MKSITPISVLTFCFILAVPFISRAEIETSEMRAKEIWSAFTAIEKIEKKEILVQATDQRHVLVQDLSCVFEAYDACSFIVINSSGRQLVVNTEVAAKLANELALAGVFVDEDNSRLYTKQVTCIEANAKISCHIL